MSDTKQKGYKAIMAAHRAMVARLPPFKHNREPKRIPFHVDAHGPFFKDRVMNRDGHNPLSGEKK